ncbi:MAG: YmdB family metallophosphoesterase [Oscillospiraceae bacterium]|jgi:metallophosphoesterase (TIGR00282 family)|nr:YmdB family metallophosphoesterase [Oscillospiraceae bacterium]
MVLNVLAIGDAVGEAGLDVLSKKLRGVKRYRDVGFTVANGENASGVGITPGQAERMFASGVDVITLGNHTWSRREICDYLDDDARILRPANYAPQAPGRGWGVYGTPLGDVCVINLIGRCDMKFGSENPFLEADRILGRLRTNIVLVDFHAEATSEKLSMAYYLDGRVSALWGTHTHVQTSDGRVFQNGMGYITDLGMTGAVNSVIGIKPELSVSNFLGNPPGRLEAASGEAKIECAVFELDAGTGRCLSVEALRIL